jgi:hypothetical protein
MREKFIIQYRPAVHDGLENKRNHLYCYEVELDESFDNRTEGEKFSGIGGTCTHTGQYKRFRMDRIVTMRHAEEGMPTKK